MYPLWQGTSPCPAIEAVGCARRTTPRFGDRPSYQCRHRPTSPGPGVPGFSVLIGRGNRFVQPDARCSFPNRSITGPGRGEILSALLDCSGRVGADRISVLSTRRNTRGAAPGEDRPRWFDGSRGDLPPFHGRSHCQKQIPNRSDRPRRRWESPCPWSMVHLLLLVDSEDFDMHRLWNMALVLAVRGGAVLQQLRPANSSTNSERCAIRELRTGAYPAISTAAICGSFCSRSTVALCGTY